MLIIYRIIWFIPPAPFLRIFSGNDSTFLCAEFKVLMFNNTGIRYFSFCIIYYSISLIIVFVFQIFSLKTQGTVCQFSVTILIELVDHTCIQYFFKSIFTVHRDKSAICAPLTESLIIGSKLHWNSFQKLLHDLRISTLGDSLIWIIKIIIVKDEADRKPFNNEAWQFLAVSAPLLLRIAFYQFLIDISSDQ